MKKIFYSGIIIFIFYEFLNNYLVMSYPGSQKLNSLEFSYFLSYYKVYFEIVLLLVITFPAIQIFKNGKRVAPIIVILFSLMVYVTFNYILTAENKFREVNSLTFETVSNNKAAMDLMIIGLDYNGETKAYPVDYIRYHHRVSDTINEKKILVTYCTLCRTGRVYEPIVNNVYTKFRLVGINHFNAMFEDEPTKSWWSQETGVCIIGKLKGYRLPELNSSNMTLQKWAALHPETKIMQPDQDFMRKYRKVDDYKENAENPKTPQKGGIWSAHTYVIGISTDSNDKAFEWNYLVSKRIIEDTIGTTKLTLVISDDNKSFAAFENPGDGHGILRNDTLFFNNTPYDFAGTNLNTSVRELKRLNAYREYWFSWQYAHPNTLRYSD